MHAWKRRVSQGLGILALLGGCSDGRSGDDPAETNDDGRTPSGSAGKPDAGKKPRTPDSGKPRTPRNDAGTPDDAEVAIPEDVDASSEDSGEAEPDSSSSDPGPKSAREGACKLVPAATGDGPAGTLSLKVEVVLQGLEVPWGLTWMPDGDMLFTERPGRLRRVRGGKLLSSPVLQVDVAQITFVEEGVGLGSEGGLLGVVLHPDFEYNRLFYLYFTARSSDNALVNRLGLYEMSKDGNSATLDRILLDGIPGGIHHQGGRMAIGPDGKLYVGVGAYDPALAQRPNELPGKLLRLNLDGTVPDDNPVADSYVFLTGIRNTQGYDWFDDEHLLVMDHGPTSIDPGVPEKGWDEFNVARAGDNLGWPRALGCEKETNITEPVMVWERSLPPGGAAIYTGTAIPEWTGSFMVATLGLPATGEGEHLHRIQVNPDNPYVVEKHEVYLKGQYGRLRTVAMGPDGHLYVTTSNCDSRGSPIRGCIEGGDKVLRIVGTN